MKIFVAGATGELGRAAIHRLVGAGHDVTGVARSPQRASLLDGMGARPALVDLFDSAAVSRAVSGHEVVCNLATHIPQALRMALPGAWKENDRIRRDGSRILVDAAIAAGASRYVQEAVSFVYADGGHDWITEDSPLDIAPNLASSMAATEAAHRFTAAGGIGVVLRFGSFYGDDPLTRWLLAQARRGRPFAMGEVDGYISCINIADAGAAVLAALSAPAGVYNVASQPALRGEFASVVARAAGAEKVRFMPKYLLKLAGPRVAAISRSHRISSEAFRQATGWQPEYPTVHEGWPTPGREAS